MPRTLIKLVSTAGTGYYYTPYVGSVWYGPPLTYGFGTAITYTPWTGWTYGFGFGWSWGSMTVGWGWGCYPWWGPVGWGYYYPYPYYRPPYWGGAAWGWMGVRPAVAMVAVPPIGCDCGVWSTVSCTVRTRVRPSCTIRSPTRASAAESIPGPRISTVVLELDVGTDTDDPPSAAPAAKAVGCGGGAGAIGMA